MIRSAIRSVVRSAVRSAVRSVIRSRFCRRRPKSIILGQTTNLNMIFHVMVSVYRLKFETRPSSLLNFRTAYFSKYFENVWITLDFSCDCQTMSRIAWHRFMNMNTLFLCWIVHKWRYMQTNIKCSCESNSRLGFHSSKHIWGHESLHQHFPGHILLWK